MQTLPAMDQRAPRLRHAPCEFRYMTEFQSHEPEFDYLKSFEIEEKINKVRWVNHPSQSRMILSTNDKTIKLWKVSASHTGASEHLIWAVAVSMHVPNDDPVTEWVMTSMRMLMPSSGHVDVCFVEIVQMTRPVHRCARPWLWPQSGAHSLPCFGHRLCLGGQALQ